MLTNRKKKQYESYLAYFLMAVAFLGAMALHAWMQANEACANRWKLHNVETEYNRRGCLVEVQKDHWVLEKEAAAIFNIPVPKKTP